MTIACYIRVSTAGQNAEGQRREIERYLAGHGLTDVQWFTDKKSGDSLDRPAFKRMQAAIFNGEVKTVVVWKLDRLSRNLRDGVNILADWCAKGIRFVSVTQNIEFDGAVGQMLAGVFLGIAQMEQETRRERQAIGIANAKAKGVYIGRKAGSTKAKPERAKRLKEQGATVEEIAAALGISRRTVFNYLASA